MEGEVFVAACYPCNEVVLECLDGSFCRVSAVDVGGYQLDISIDLVHKGFQYLGAFIVQNVELGS